MSVEYAWYEIRAPIAELDFRVELPAGWIVHELPGQEPDFDNAAFLLPLAIITAPHSALVFACAARPAYPDGTLHDWTWQLLRANDIEPLAVGEHRLGSMQALIGETLTQSGLGPMRVRFAFAEDGGRLLQVSLSAPEMLDSAVVDAWFRLLDGFALQSPRGSTVPLFPPQQAAPNPDAEGVDYAFALHEDEAGQSSPRAHRQEPGDSRAPDGPAWWSRALELERQDRLAEAEQLLRDSIPHLFFARQIAELYRLRMHRLGAAGDEAGARAAYREADEWIGFYAGLATSGGEGAALSRERDGFREALRAEFGA